MSLRRGGRWVGSEQKWTPGAGAYDTRTRPAQGGGRRNGSRRTRGARDASRGAPCGGGSGAAGRGGVRHGGGGGAGGGGGGAGGAGGMDADGRDEASELAQRLEAVELPPPVKAAADRELQWESLRNQGEPPTPEDVAATAQSHTGAFLASMLNVKPRKSKRPKAKAA